MFLSILFIVFAENIWLYDIEQYVEISLLKGIQSLKTNPNNYIKLHTESLAFIFDFDYGIDTFAVAARFDSDEETFNDFTTTFAIGELNNTGKFLKFNNIYKFIEIDFIWRILKFFRKGVGN